MFILSAAAAKRKEKVETNKKVRSSVKEPKFLFSARLCVSCRKLRLQGTSDILGLDCYCVQYAKIKPIFSVYTALR